MRTSTSVWVVGGLLSGVGNAMPDGFHLLNAVLGIRDETPPSSTVTIPGYTSTNSGGAIEITQTSGVTPVPTTYSIPPSTVTVPPQVIVVPPIIEAKVCPEPTGLTRDPGVKFTGNYGCPVGQICKPEKPEGCNVWPGPPRVDFKCNDFDCIPIPLAEPETRSDGGFHPLWGFFHVDPRNFGHGYEVFEYGHTSGGQRRALNWPNKRQNGSREVEPDCMPDCNRAFEIRQGGDPNEPDAICEDGSEFLPTLKTCTECLRVSQNATKSTIRRILGKELEPMLDACGFQNSFPVGYPEGEEVETPPEGTETTGQGTPSPTGTPVIPPPSNPPPTPTPTPTPSPSPTPPPSSSTPSSTPEPSPSTESETTPAPPNSTSTGPDESTPSEASSSSGTLPDSSSSSAEPPSSGSPGSPSTGSPESSSTDSPESPPTGSADVPSASSAETPGSPESQGTDSPSASDSSALAPGTSSAPSETVDTPTPVPSAPNVTTDETGTRTTLGVVPNPVPTTQDTVVVPTPGGTPAPLPPPSAAFRTTVGATILATLLTFLAVLA